jgi:hypothetical protein
VQVFRTAAALAFLIGAGVAVSGATIHGQVTTVLGRNVETVPGAKVTLFGSGMQGARVAVADRRGDYCFVGVPAGSNYRLVAELEGFGSWPMTVEYIFADDVVVADVPLDGTIRECSLGRSWQVPTVMPGPATFRFRSARR